MVSDRYVVLGLAQPRASWFGAVAQWAHAASIAVEFVKCVSAEEVRARLASGRPFSALLVDAGLTSLDRDLLDAARRADCPVVVVEDPRIRRDWAALGAAAVLGEGFDRGQLVATLSLHARRIRRGDALPGAPTSSGAGGRQADVAVVCGSGGTGSSTIAVALAQGLASVVGQEGVLLADFALHAEQAMLHDVRDVVPGVQELVEAHRSGRPQRDDVKAMTFLMKERGYFLLLGLRRSRAWSTLRPRAFEATMSSLEEAFTTLVCDTDAVFEGENETGSLEVQERHTMSRSAAANADVVMAVGLPGMKGIHALVRVVTDVLDFGVSPGRIVPVFNRAPRSPRHRSELARAFAALVPQSAGGALPTPIFVPERGVEEAFRDGVRLPVAMTDPVVGAYRAVLHRSGTSPVALADAEPRLVRPGSLGAWSDGEDREDAGTGHGGSPPDEAAVG